MPHVLVGIPTHKRPDLLRKCLESIAAQSGVEDISVFVADNDPVSREGVKVAAELASTFRFPMSAAVVEEKGLAEVRNAIVSEARTQKADFLAMIDDDEAASPQWLSELLEVQSATGADVVGGPVFFEFAAPVPDRIRHSGAFPLIDRPSGLADFVAATGNVLISCQALDEAGWPRFDSRFGLTGGEDIEYFLRLRARGASFAWADQAAVSETVPPSRLTTSWILKRNFRQGNAGYRLDRMYGQGRARSLAWGVANLAATPLLALLWLHPKLGLRALRRLSYAAGIVASAMGISYSEYGSRH